MAIHGIRQTTLLEVGDEASVADIDPETDAVNVMTAHAAKGLEWRVVFIVNLAADRFPSRRRRDPLPIPDGLIKERLPEGDFHLEEERRLFYVAATRAKDLLYLCFSEDGGGKRKRKISQFVLELLDSPNLSPSRKKLSSLEKIERFKKMPQEPLILPKKFDVERVRLSRLQLDDYHTCPKKFYFGHIIRIPLLENHALMYGTAILASVSIQLSRNADCICATTGPSKRKCESRQWSLS
jgi:DNA helicase-2/ATP-dependent DNA helicase PcrA